MRKNFSAILHHKNLGRFVWADIIIISLFVLVTIWKWSALPPQLPLFYSLPRSPDQLGTPLQLLILPLFAIFFSAVNLSLAAFYYIKEQLAAIILVCMSTAISLLIFMSFIKIIFLIS